MDLTDIKIEDIPSPENYLLIELKCTKVEGNIHYLDWDFGSPPIYFMYAKHEIYYDTSTEQFWGSSALFLDDPDDENKRKRVVFKWKWPEQASGED